MNMADADRITVKVLITRDDPAGSATVERVSEIVKRITPDVRVRSVEVANNEEAVALGFSGSPTILVSGMDIEGPRSGHPAMSARMYEKDSPIPPVWMVEAAILRAIRPRMLLFLCVANSARSQMAEGIARYLAPPGVQVASAGSNPDKVRLQAIRALKEIGIDISSHYSKSVESIPPDMVEAVVTLCIEEVCPFLPRPVPRLHWGMPDPAAVTGIGEQQMEAFREVRDELHRRLRFLFSHWKNPGKPGTGTAIHFS